MTPTNQGTKPSPRPWRLAKWPHEQEVMGCTLPGTKAVLAADNISPAIVWGGIVESEANADLIVAAVNSYEGLRAALEGLVAAVGDCGYDCRQLDVRDAVSAARAALAASKEEK